MTMTARLYIQRLLVSGILIALLLFSGGNFTVPVYASGTITGTVFQDYNADGFQNLVASPALPAVDHGVAGITVTAYNASGAPVGTATTALDGSYTLATTDAGSGPYRVEFTGLPTSYQSGAIGASSGSSVQFVNAGGTANLGINEPADYCQNNPDLCTSLMISGDTNTIAPTQALLKFSYNNSGTSPAPTTIATKSQVGSTWGQAYARTTKTIYSAAFLKRHVGLGPNGLGAIYATDAAGTTSTLFADLTALGVNVGSVLSNSARGLGAPTAPSNDPTTFDQIGKVGLGDIDISDDERTLYVVNLNDQKLYALNIPAGTMAGSYTIPDPGCVGGVWRPFATKFKYGTLYVGGVCDAQMSQSAADLQAYVLRFTPGLNSWSQVFTFALNYPKGAAKNNAGGCIPLTGWYPWLNSLPAGCATTGINNIYVHPQPMLADIEFDVDGSMILGFFDRLGHQVGWSNYEPTGTNFEQNVMGGDILRAYNNNGTYVLENNATAGPVTTAGAGNGQGPGGGEFYWSDNFQNAHLETVEGGMALLPGSGEVVANAMDPTEADSGGPYWFNNTTGDSPHKYRIHTSFFQGNNGFFGKAAGLGDLEVLCDSAPIEIGNRVWNDADGDGVQDAGEAPIAGVTVQLLDSTGSVIATAVTDANGNYLFSNLAGGTSTTSALYGLPITANTNYTVQVPTGQAALAAFAPTTPTADGTANGTSRDSNGVVSGANDVATVTTGAAGANNHTIDFGFFTPVSIGNQVWYDTDNNGQINGSEVGVNGVRVELFLDTNGDGVLTGAEQTPVAVQTTSSGGYYLFTQTTNASGVGTGTALPPGQYIVGVAPSNFATGGVLAGSHSSGTTISNTGVVSEAAIAANGTTDSNVDNADDGTTQTSGFYTSGVLSGPIVVTAGGEPGGTTPGHPNTVNGTAGGMTIPNTSSNPTVDFGFYRQTLGNLVFNDTNNDGVYTASTDTPIAGAIVKLFAADGTTEILVGPDGILGTADDAPGGVVTGASGTYVFSGLPQGQYVVQVTPPTGYSSSTDIASSTNPNGNIDNDDNGVGGGSGPVSSAPITLTPGSAGTTSANIVDTTTGTTANPTLDFGFYTLSLGNQVWNDVNNNGVKDASETGVDGVKVNLFLDTNGNGILDAADTPAGSQTTSNGGHYLFTNLLPGSYLVQLDGSNFATGGPLAGYQSSTGSNGSASGPYEPGKNTAADIDDNGTINTGGLATAGRTGGIVSGPIVLQAGTQPTNEIDLGLPTGITNTASNANSNLTVDFGVFQPASLGDYVWLDTNKNGVQDAGEPGVPGVTVTLYDGNGNPLATTTTNANGHYQFINLSPGTYSVGFTTLPSGYVITMQDQGGNDTTDSDVNVTTGRTPPITIGAGAFNPTIDMGIAPTATAVLPTAITLAQFTASHTVNGVVVRWTTTAEEHTFSFQLARSTTGSAADAVRVTTQPIAAVGRGMSGASYTWTDPTALAGVAYTYWLVETEVDGTTHTYGPALLGVTTVQRTGVTAQMFLPFVTR